MESSVSAEEKIAGENNDLTKDREFILSLNEKDEEDDDEKPMSWKMKALMDSK